MGAREKANLLLGRMESLRRMAKRRTDCQKVRMMNEMWLSRAGRANVASSDELNEEDVQLKSELEMLVERLQVGSVLTCHAKSTSS